MGGKSGLKARPIKEVLSTSPPNLGYPKRKRHCSILRSLTTLSGIPALVVDDNATQSTHPRTDPEELGYETDDRQQRRRSLRELRRAADSGSPIPLVLLDAQMPLLDGFGTAAAITQDPGIPTTGNYDPHFRGQRGDVERCRELGISGDLDQARPPSRASTGHLPGPWLTTARRKHPECGYASCAPMTRPKGLRVLLAEDNAVNRELAVRILSKRGHIVTTAANGNAH